MGRIFQQILPDLTEERWAYNGTVAFEAGRHKGKSAHSWVWELTNKASYGQYDNTYTFYVDEVCFRIYAPLPVLALMLPTPRGVTLKLRPDGETDNELRCSCVQLLCCQAL